MILKVKTGNGDWKYYEGFYAAEVSRVPPSTVVSADEFHYQPAQGLDMPNKPMNAAIPPKTMVRMSYPSETVVVFDTEAYLLNYEGKTIERL